MKAEWTRELQAAPVEPIWARLVVEVFSPQVLLPKPIFDRQAGCQYRLVTKDENGSVVSIEPLESEVPDDPPA